MTNKKQTKAVVASKEVVAEKSYRAPNCSVNFKVIVDFKNEMKLLKLAKDSSVNDIMLALYKKHGTNLNPNVLAKQIRDFKNVGKVETDKDCCKCSMNCIGWYKNHYNKELNKFVSTKKKGLTKEQILDRLYAIDEIKNSAIADYIPSLSLTKLKEIALKYELV